MHLITEKVARFDHLANQFLDDLAKAYSVELILVSRGQRLNLEPLFDVLNFLTVAKRDIPRI